MRNTNIRLELRVDEIKNDIQKIKFGQMMMLDEEKVHENATYKNGWETTKRKTKNQMDRPN
jgi:hypothetical protein